METSDEKCNHTHDLYDWYPVYSYYRNRSMADNHSPVIDITMYHRARTTMKNKGESN